jgi:dsDNA-specific endonuclease/ATPase MutS2
MFKIGDKVRFLDEVGEGIILSFKDKKTAIVELESGLNAPFLISQLVVVNDILNKTTHFEKPEKKEVLKGVKKVVIEKEQQDGPKISQKHQKNRKHTLEVDLHIEELIDKYNHLSNGQIMEIQLRHFRKNLENAIEKGEHSIVFIHGVGNGVLKTEIRKILDTYHGISYQDGSFRKYGFGATEVIIH